MGYMQYGRETRRKKARSLKQFISLDKPDYYRNQIR
jgi:hypothetical protein